MPNTEKEIRKTIPFPRASKYLGISLVKENLDPYNENFKTLKKKRRYQKMERPSTLIDCLG